MTIKNEIATEKARQNVLKQSNETEELNIEVKGLDFNSDINLNHLLSSYYTTGYQATNLAKSIDIINNMVFLN